MKYLITFLIFAVFAFSCDFDDQPVSGEHVQKWVIAGYQPGDNSNSNYITVRDSAFSYSLLPDGTVRKSMGNQAISGTYEERFEDGLRKFLFHYESGDVALIHGCNDAQEEYFLNSQGQLTGTWDACDGAKLYFNKQ